MGYFKVENKVVDELNFENSTEFGVYMILLRYGSGGQTAYPSQDFMRERLRTSNRKISTAITSLEEKKLIKVTRVHRSFNRYIVTPITSVVAPTKMKFLPSAVEEYKEQEININKRRELLTEIHTLASRGTGDNIFLFQQVFTGRGLSEEELKIMRAKIEESDFLMGKLENKPTIRHYDSQKQIDKIRMGYYRNSVREKKIKPEEIKPPYHYEFEERETVYYEPNY